MKDEREELNRWLKELQLDIGGQQDRVKHFLELMQGHYESLKLQLEQVKDGTARKQILEKVYTHENLMQQMHGLQNSLSQSNHYAEWVWLQCSWYNWALQQEKERVNRLELQEELAAERHDNLHLERERQEREEAQKSWALSALKARLYPYPR